MNPARDAIPGEGPIGVACSEGSPCCAAGIDLRNPDAAVSASNGFAR
jgi:hypothetical protein